MAIVEVHTDEGIVGLGEVHRGGGTLTGIEQVVIHFIKPIIEGESPLCVERVWQKVFWDLGGTGRRGLLVAALSGIDVALWDIIGKAYNTPVYKLLGVHKDKVLAYASAGFYGKINGKEVTKEMLADEMAYYVKEEGFKAVKVKIGGVPMKEDIARLEAVRGAIGEDIKLLIDANNMYSPKQAIQFAKAVGHLNIDHFEEPVQTDDIVGSAHVAASIDIPVAGYETEFTRYGFRELITRRAVDIVQPYPVWAGGITESRKIATLAAAYDLIVRPTSISSAIDTVVSLHLLASLPNGDMLELRRANQAPGGPRDIFLEEIVINPLKIDEEGYVNLPQKPGLGIELNEEVVAKYTV